jgi:hypothetical protein
MTAGSIAPPSGAETAMISSFSIVVHSSPEKYSIQRGNRDPAFPARRNDDEPLIRRRVVVSGRW